MRSMETKLLRVTANLALSGVLAVSALALPTKVAVAAEDEKETVSAQLLLVNDLHGKIDHKDSFADYDGDGENDPAGGVPYLATYLEQREQENPNSLLVHSGDMVGGSPIVSSYFQDEPTVEIMEEMGFDVGTLGNHEFDEGVEEMLRMINGGDHPDGTPDYDGIDFPMIAANVQYKDSKDLVIDPYRIEEVAGEKIGFIGVVTTETPNMIISEGNENVEFTDEATAINKYVPELKEQGVKAIVVLAHNPAEQNEDKITGDVANIANEIDDEVDIIMAAHNHTYNNGMVDGKLIVQAYSYGTAFADVDIEIDPETGDIVNKKAEVVTSFQEKVEPDAEVAAILNRYEEKVAPIKQEVIGETAYGIEGGYAEAGEIGDNALGNLIADGMKAEMDADFALMNGGGIRDSLPKGEVTWGDLFDVQPFGNILNKVDVTGSDLENILNAQISEQHGPDVSVAGFHYTWNDETNKVVDITLPNGTSIDADKTYSVVVNNYMYGNEEYRLAELGENKEVGPNDLQATINYVESLDQPIEYKAEGRISTVQASNGFNDVSEGDWAYEMIHDLAQDGVFEGVYQDEFKKDAALTRGEFVRMLVRVLDLKSTKDTLEDPFEDVEDPAFALAYEHGVTKGVKEGIFAPDQELNRVQMAVLLMRGYDVVSDQEVNVSVEDTFKDGGTFVWAHDEVLKGHALGLYNGYSNGHFAPKDIAKRDQGAAVLYRLKSLLNQ
ncbi:2,' 3'-cyclic nucleotide 2'-phosphodiesterase [Pontibacillus yanchengensis]|uniref:2,' 3'-cyclic nucleotide 2'-phosphodiesterase n=3 Tax=Pontibacillus yanchengensis TaxID=462910 RepID=A0A6I5A2X4_9BACI|nr:2,' 3'-cyclic nucleotide 2'-phosphodiesterase [Pontibacillus yanchengensis]MYL53020.1 2,' 3'-cyclic nucleotide 2'-phosphodiesterase [Pontibacillus yanchengensis]